MREVAGHIQYAMTAPGGQIEGTAAEREVASDGYDAVRVGSELQPAACLRIIPADGQVADPVVPEPHETRSAAAQGEVTVHRGQTSLGGNRA